MHRRVLPAIAAASLVVAGLAGCSASDPQNACETPLQPGALSSSVTIIGESEAGPKVKITGPTDIMNAQRSVLVEHQGGPMVQGGDVTTVNVTIFDAKTGAELSPSQKRFLQAMPDDVMPDLTAYLQSSDADMLRHTDLMMAAVRCSTPGDTLAVAVTAGQARASQLGDEAVVLVVEVLATQPMAASGAQRALPSGFPAVTTNETGRPGVVLPPHAAPTELLVAPRIEGTGAVVSAEDYMIGNVLTVGWDGTERGNTWGTSVAEFGTEAQPGKGFEFRAALTGQRVGSQVVVLDPNNGDPVVRVVDIIAVG